MVAGRSHGQVISAHTASTNTVATTTYHGHGPIRSKRLAVEGFRLRNP
ncbi:Uncharacterised protein [Mycobacteroides abscessus subsp. abscessus]|nr:Uncharacterised protein [Mycobacteroides abscessus subsp. abscessus]